MKRAVEGAAKASRCGRLGGAAVVAAFAWLGLSAAACSHETTVAVGSPDETDDNVGLFTPGHKISATTTSGLTVVAGDGAGSAGSGAPAAPVCNGTNTTWVDDQDGGGVPTDCLTVDLTTDGPIGHYDKMPGERENIGVVWVEDADGGYVKGLEAWGQKYAAMGQRYWLFIKQRINCPDPDIITSATMHVHQEHHLTWQCQDTEGQLVRDGNYVLWIDVQIDENQPQQQVQIPFVKGPDGYTMMLPTTPTVKSGSITYTPVP